MNLEALMSAPEEAQKKYIALVESDSATHKAVSEANVEVRKAREALAAAITEDSKPCPSCGGHPHGMVQVWVVEKEKIVGFEIGCSRCADHCAVGYMAEELDERLAAAQRKWNAGPDKWYFATGSTVRLTLDTDSGEVVLRYIGLDGHGIGGKYPSVSCAVHKPTDSEVSAFAEANKLEDKSEAEHRLFVQAVKDRDARVEAFKKTYQVAAEPSLTVH